MKRTVLLTSESLILQTFLYPFNADQVELEKMLPTYNPTSLQKQLKVEVPVQCFKKNVLQWFD